MAKFVLMTKSLAPIVVEILFCVDFIINCMTKRDAKKIATDSGIKLQKKLCQKTVITEI